MKSFSKFLLIKDWGLFLWRGIFGLLVFGEVLVKYLFNIVVFLIGWKIRLLFDFNGCICLKFLLSFDIDLLICYYFFGGMDLLIKDDIVLL